MRFAHPFPWTPTLYPSPQGGRCFFDFPADSSALRRERRLKCCDERTPKAVNIRLPEHSPHPLFPLYSLPDKCISFRLLEDAGMIEKHDVSYLKNTLFATLQIC